MYQSSNARPAFINEIPILIFYLFLTKHFMEATIETLKLLIEDCPYSMKKLPKSLRELLIAVDYDYRDKTYDVKFLVDTPHWRGMFAMITDYQAPPTLRHLSAAIFIGYRLGRIDGSSSSSAL